jgi:hypothetical protein
MLTMFSLTIGMPLMGASAGLSSASASPIAPCSGSSLWAAYIGSAGATGNLIYTIALINVSHSACRLEGYPKLRGFRNSRWYWLPISQHGTYAGNLSPTILSPRMSGELLLSTADDCNALNTGGQTRIKKAMLANTYTNLSIELPDSDDDIFLTGLDIDIACGLEESQLGWRSN